jgi:hypothetical protein
MHLPTANNFNIIPEIGLQLTERVAAFTAISVLI